jgi:FkbM family methyltransferase
VEVGAFDGITWSNTSCLANRGWRGLYIEPVKSIFNQLVKNYEDKPNITCLNLAIDREAGETTIYDMGQLSTLNPNMVQVYQSIPWSQGCAQNPVTQLVTKDTLTHVLENHGIPSNFDVLVVDVEGYELAVLQSLDFSKFLPRVIIIELEDEHEDFSTRDDCAKLMDNIKKCRELITQHGYRPVYKDKINTVYIGGEPSFPWTPPYDK